MSVNILLNPVESRHYHLNLSIYIMTIKASNEIHFPLDSTLQHISLKVPSGQMQPLDEATQARLFPVKGRWLDHPPPDAALRTGLVTGKCEQGVCQILAHRTPRDNVCCQGLMFLVVFTLSPAVRIPFDSAGRLSRFT